MKTGKKFWCILLALVMLLGMAAPVAYAETEEAPEAVTVENITAEPATFLEGVYSYTITSEEGEEIGVYNPMEVGFTVTIHYSDGSTTQCYPYELYSMFNTVENITDIQDTNAWTVGDHVFQMQVDEFTLDVPVIIKANPVASVTVEPVTAYMGIHQREGEYYDEELQDFAQGKVFDIWNLSYRFNITFTDGTTKTLSRNELWDSGLDYSTMISDGETKNWTAGNTYELPMKVSGIKCVAKVTVLENPVTAVHVPDIQMKKSEAYDGQYYFTEKMRVELTDTDGTVHSMKLYELYEMDIYPDFQDPQYEGVVFEPGQTYSIPYKVLGYEGQFKVEIIDDSIDTITAQAQHSLYETLSSNVGNLSSADPIITVTRKDGTSITFPYSEYGMYINTEVWLEPVEAPEGEHLPVGEHEVAIFIEDAVGTFTLTVLENPVESFTVTTKYPFVKNKDGWYDYGGVAHAVVLKLKDGTTETHTEYETLWEKYHTYDCVPYLLNEGPLDAGTHQVDAVLMGMISKQTVTIVDSGIQSVTATYDGVLVENVDGYSDGYYDENGEWVSFYYYMPHWENLRITVTFEDGTTKTVGIYDTLMGSRVENLMQIFYTQDFENPWKVGKNKVAGSLLGHEFAFEIEVVENTIKDITVKATKPLYMDWHIWGLDSTGVPMLDTREAGLEITITYADGTTKTYTYDEFTIAFPTAGISPVDGDAVGTKKANLWFGDNGYPFEVEVKTNPVKSVAVAPSKTLTELNGEAEYAIEDTVPVYTVTYTDGTTATFYGDAQLTEKFGVYPIWETPEKYVVGKNEAEVTVFGHTAEYTFEIVKPANPLKSISAKAVAPLYLNNDPYFDYYDYTALVEVTLTYADGTTKTVMANELRDAAGNYAISFEDNQSSTQWNVGKYAVVAVYKGLKAEFTVEVVANPYVKLSISAENGLTVTLEKKDGGKEVMTARSYQVDSIGDKAAYGYLFTDKGTISVIFYFKDSDPANIDCMEYNGLKSNALEGCKWLSSQMATAGTSNVVIDKNAQELAQLVDKNAFRVWVTASYLDSVAANEAAKIQGATPKGYQSALLLDLQLHKMTQYGVYQISETSGSIGFTIPVPQALIDAGLLLDSFKVVRLHNGVADVLDAVYNKASQTVSFQTDLFSTYALVYSAHKLTKVDAKAATCTEDGNQEYYTCSHCSMLFADDKAQTETTAEAVVIKAGHKIEKVDAKAATTEATGLKEHYKCSVCGKLFADAEGKTETTEAEVTVDKLTPETDTEPDTDKKPDTGSNPDTGDETPLFVLFVLMISSALLAAGTVLGRKKFH